MLLTEYVLSLSWKGYVILTVTICSIAIWTTIVLYYVKWRTSPLNKIPGPKQGFVVGSMQEIRTEPYLSPHKRWIQELCGYENLPLLRYTLVLGRYSVMVLDKDIVRTILTTQLQPGHSTSIQTESSPKTEEHSATSRFHKGPVGILRSRIGDGLVTLAGEDWKRHRRILQPSFHTDFLKDSLNEVVPPLAERFVSCWKQSLKNHNENRPREIDVASHLAALTLDVVGKVLFAHEFNGLQAIGEWANASPASGGDTGSPYNDAQVAQPDDPFIRTLNDALKPSLFTMFVMASRLDVLDATINPQARKICRALNAAAEQVIASALDTDHRSTMHSKSLLHLMLQAEDPEQPQGISSAQQQRRTLNRDEIRDEIKTFLMAGHETTSTWLYWALYALAKHPDVQDRLYQDIVQHAYSATSATPIDLKQIAKMEFLQAFLQEVLRLYPPVGFITRFNSFPEEFAGYKIPAGTRLALPIHLLQRNPRYWDDPETFLPERWLNVSDAEQERRHFAFLPFSAGARNCIGYRFATLEAQLIVASIVRGLHIRIAPSQRDTNHTFTPTITMKAKPALKIIVQDRQTG